MSMASNNYNSQSVFHIVTQKFELSVTSIIFLSVMLVSVVIITCTSTFIYLLFLCANHYLTNTGIQKKVRNVYSPLHIYETSA